MSIAPSLRKVASKLVAKFGGEATLRRVVAGVYNPKTGKSGETVTDTALRGVLQDVTRREVNELVQAGDKRLIIAAADTTAVPTPADRIIISGRSLQIIEVRTIEQGNQPITYELILRD